MLESITVGLIRLISCSCSQWLRGFLLRNDFNMTPFCLLFIPVIKKKKKKHQVIFQVLKLLPQPTAAVT